MHGLYRENVVEQCIKTSNNLVEMMPGSLKSLYICSLTFLLPVNNKGFAIILSRGSKRAIIWKSPIGDNAFYGEFVPSAIYGGEVNEECEWVSPVWIACIVFKF